MHGALLVAGIPEGLEEAAVEAVVQPAFRPPPHPRPGTCRLCNTRAARDQKAEAARWSLRRP